MSTRENIRLIARTPFRHKLAFKQVDDVHNNVTYIGQNCITIMPKINMI